MYEVGQEVMVISDKGVAYDGKIMARATSEDGRKAYKIAVDGGGLSQLGQWHRASDIFLVDAAETSMKVIPWTAKAFRTN
ncbi:MAG TPA: hypothetical protein VMU48_03960 [Terracidiphilus sp.]|nr:hypothetical protein [Terracidiphilus sp.]